jgi:hypothetical protein
MPCVKLVSKPGTSVWKKGLGSRSRPLSPCLLTRRAGTDMRPGHANTPRVLPTSCSASPRCTSKLCHAAGATRGTSAASHDAHLLGRPRLPGFSDRLFRVSVLSICIPHVAVAARDRIRSLVFVSARALLPEEKPHCLQLQQVRTFLRVGTSLFPQIAAPPVVSARVGSTGVA